ncbi:MAG: endonuclease domain-containing protein [Bacillota bacterium]
MLPETGRGTIRRRANGGGGSSLRKPEVYAARQLRRAMTDAEVLIWSQLRGAKLGVKVRRQHPIGPYVADFFVRDRGLVIEVDGSSHDFGERPLRDERRDRYMKERGCRVLRISATDVTKNLDGVLSLIREHVANPLHHPSDGPPPHAGEDF